jgi:PAS domain S-box-containing protein
MKIHPLLEWQMAQCLPQNLQKSPEMEALLASVNESYHTLQPVARRHQMGVLDGETSQNHIVKTRVFQDFTRRWGKRIKSRIFSKEESGDKDAEQVLLQNPVLGKTLSAENEEMVLRTLGQNLPNPVFWIDHNGTIIFANNAFCQHIQYTQPWETLIGKSSDFILDLCGKLYKNEEKFIYRTKAHFSKQERINAERLEMVDERVMLRDFIPIFRDGEFRGAMVQYVDITKIILNEKGLKQAENFNSLILKASLSAIVMIDELGKIALWNPKSETIFGFTASEAMGFSFSELVFDASNREFFEA